MDFKTVWHNSSPKPVPVQDRVLTSPSHLNKTTFWRTYLIRTRPHFDTPILSEQGCLLTRPTLNSKIIGCFKGNTFAEVMITKYNKLSLKRV